MTDRTSRSSAEHHQLRFVDRHIGPDADAVATMLGVIGVDSLEELAAKALPAGILDALSSVGLAPGLDELAAPASEEQSLAELRALAGSMLNHTLPMDAPAPVKQIINPGHAHEAMDRCHVLLCTLNDHLLQHPYVESDADVRREVETANAALSRAYQLIGGFPHKDAK